jgi:glycosyltransferase involved in cell wall biosynthesis
MTDSFPDTMKRPLVSVIIPVYNGAKFIKEAIESIFKQNYDPMEIIVIDDGSTDDTSSIVQSFQDIRYIRQDNLGCAAARNNGITESTGELLAFLDADDYWADNKLNIQVRCLLKHPHIGYTLGKQRNFLESGTDRPSWLRKELLLEEHTGFLPTLVIHRRIFDMVGLFNTNFRISSDVEWFSRLADASISRMVVPEVVLYRRIHGSNLGYENLGFKTKAGNPLLLKALRDSVHRKQKKISDS